MIDRRRFLEVAAAAVASSSCGYALAGRGSFLPAYIRVVGIPMFLNRTPYATVEQVFTEKVRIEFQSRRYSVNPTETGADGIVRGEITGISAAPVGFGDAQLATRFRFTIAVGVKFDDAKEKKTLWENAALSFSDEYELANRNSIGLGGAAFIDQERAVMERLSTDFARSVVSAILEAF
jgi:hypothetical protein